MINNLNNYFYICICIVSFVNYSAFSNYFEYYNTLNHGNEQKDGNSSCFTTFAIIYC